MDSQTHAWFEYLAEWFKYLNHRLDVLQANFSLSTEEAAKLAALKVHIDAKKATLQQIIDTNKPKP